VAQHVVDDLEAGDAHEGDRNSLAPPCTQVAQRAIELIHEKAPIGQPGKRIVKARVVERFLQAQSLLHLLRKILVYRVQPLAG